MTDTNAGDATNRINEVLAERNEELEKELAEMRALLGRPLTVTVQSADSHVLKQIGDYLPQLTFMATNISHVASAIQKSNEVGNSLRLAVNEQTRVLERIADALDSEAEGDET